MIQATFETATLADAVAKAARHAPQKGSAIDRSAGIVLEIDPVTMKCVVRTTDLAIFYRQEISMVGVKGDQEPAAWRLSSTLFSAVVGQLPLHMGATVSLAEKDPDENTIWLKAGKIKARLYLIDRGFAFPKWDAFDPEGMTVVENLAERLGQVGWAVDAKSSSILGGVYMDGEFLYATDRTVAVRVPLECTLEAPVCAPMQEIVSLVKNHPELHIRVEDQFLQVMPDPDTQLKVLLLEGEFPPVGQFITMDMPVTMDLEREPLLEAIDRLLVIAQGERYPLLKMEFEGATLRLTIEAPEIGRISEELELGGVVEPFKFWVSPNYLRPMLRAASKPRITFERHNDPHQPFRVSNSDGFLSVTAPRRISEKGQDGGEEE